MEGKKLKVRFVFHDEGCSKYTEEVRCTDCHALLFKRLQKSASSSMGIEVKCRRCGAVIQL